MRGGDFAVVVGADHHDGDDDDDGDDGKGRLQRCVEEGGPRTNGRVGLMRAEPANASLT